ncbi:hypothetical protein OTU49_009085, partial [Cherax quadricarinatus]
TPSEDGYTFECQHGANECHGNLVVSCAKSIIVEHNTFVDFTICLMTGESPPDEGERCAQEVGVEWDPINQCAESVDGELLLYEQGQKQEALDPVPDWMPWIIINDEFTEDNLVEAQVDLLNLVCRVYEGSPPPGCA